MVSRSESSPLYVYRGIHGGHPALSAAHNYGIVYAADPNAKLTPGVHHSEGFSGESQYTSWSYSYAIALEFAHSKTPPSRSAS